MDERELFNMVNNHSDEARRQEQERQMFQMVNNNSERRDRLYESSHSQTKISTKNMRRKKQNKNVEKKKCYVSQFFLIKKKGKYQSIRNIPFSLKSQYFWVFDASVTAEEIAEKIVIRKERIKEHEGP